MLASCAACCACEACTCCAGAAFSCCGKVFKCRTSITTRAIYAAMFFISVIVAWIMRDNSQALSTQLQSNDGVVCPDGVDCYGEINVLRITLGNVMFFFPLSLILIGVKTSKEARGAIQNGFWPIKIILWLGLQVVTFFIPGTFFFGYASFTIFGAGIFILIQVLILIDFAYHWNESWVAKDTKLWYGLILASCGFLLILTVVLTVLMYVWFPNPAPDGTDCGLSTFFITFCLILSVVFIAITLHPSLERAALLPACVVAFYNSYMCLSGLLSETTACNTLSGGVATQSPQWVTILGLIFTLLAIVYSAFKSGSQVEAFTIAKHEEGADDDYVMEEDENSNDDEVHGVTYHYAFFHLMFALAAMYCGMVLVSWELDEVHSATTMDVGVTSMWVKEVTVWVTAALYLWTLFAPVVLKNRDFD